jgi:TetR/AcrR family transcriptional repressor of lmrAB and yxaGH operons
MPRASAVEPSVSPRTHLVLAALDLLRRSGLSGAGINQVVEASRAPKGSVYHYFPGGKQQLVLEALQEARRAVGENFAGIFRGNAPVAEKIRGLFTKTAAAVAANQFAKGCPVAAVTLDLDADSEPLRRACEDIFDTWVDVISRGLADVPRSERPAIARLTLASLEGGLVLARAAGAAAPLVEIGNTLATALTARFPRRGRAGRRP